MSQVRDLKREFARAVKDIRLKRYVAAEKSLKRLEKKMPGNASVLYNLGFLYHSKGNYSVAEGFYMQVQKQKALPFETAQNLGHVLFLQQRYEEAERHYQQALKLKSDSVPVLYALAILYEQIDKKVDAIYTLEMAHLIQPDNDKIAYHLLNSYYQNQKWYKAINLASNLLQQSYDSRFAELYAVCNLEIGQYEEAINHFQKLLEDDPVNPQYHHQMAMSLVRQEKTSVAIRYYEAALKLNANLPGLRADYGLALFTLGEKDMARGVLQDAITHDPKDAKAHHRLVGITKYRDSHSEHAQQITQMLKSADLSEEQEMYLHFALGKIHDDCREFDVAFKHYRMANHSKRKEVVYSGQDTATFFNKIITIFNSDFFAKRNGYGLSDDTPIFIVGMPRSGTTLVEQIISSHPEVLGGGEMLTMNKVIRKLNDGQPGDRFLDTIAHMQKAKSEDYARMICSIMKETAGETAQRITDKMPYNFLYLGIIALFLPTAKIIHCQRNLLDTAISIYFQLFARTNDFAYSLTEIGEYIVLYQKMMQHWEENLPIEIYPLSYETLVDDIEQESRKLIEFVGLDWSPECLQFHQQKRVVQTLSSWQVRQPIYRSSKERWRNYESHLEELRQTLGVA